VFSEYGDHLQKDAIAAYMVYRLYTVFQKTGTLFISFIIHSNDDQFIRNFYQM